MALDIEELKKDHNTNYLATQLEKILREEAEVRAMLDSDESLHELAGKELQTIQEEKERIEKQIQDILDKEKEKEEFPNEIVLEVRAGAGGGKIS
jgi:protein subunit release factor A